MEEGPGSCEVEDWTGNGMIGFLQEMDCADAWSTDVPPNRGHSYSLYLGGGESNAHLISEPVDWLPAENSPRTLCAWVKSTDGVPNGWAEHVVNYGLPTNGQAFGLMIYSGNAWHAYRHDNDINTGIPANNSWNHHCLAHDGEFFTYYLNGETALATETAFNTMPGTPLVVGNRPDIVDGAAFEGWVDDLRLYDRALSTDEVQILFAPSGDESTSAPEPVPEPASPSDTGVSVDTTPATVILAQDTFTTSAYSTVNGLIFSGEISDDIGVTHLTASLNVDGTETALIAHLNPVDPPANYWQGNALYRVAPWSAAWRPDATAVPPDATEGTLTLTIFGTGPEPTKLEYPVTLDLQAPYLGQPTILFNGNPAGANHTYIDAVLETLVSISPVEDASGTNLWYGWTERATADVSDLFQAEDVAAGVQLDQGFSLTAEEGRRIHYFHMIASDGFGNTSRRVYGPYYHDIPGMPDHINIPELHGGAVSDPYREWKRNQCTRLGTDQRITSSGFDVAQSLYLTWDESLVHLLWEGADWETDGDLFVYLDTIPGQGGWGAYNPYASTAQSTVLLLPTHGEPEGQELNSMAADFALWVTDNRTAHLLRWDGSGWIDDGSLESLGGAYAFNHEVDGNYTDLVLPYELIGNPTDSMDLVAFAVDGTEGPSGGLRLWSALPYANPLDSASVISNARSPDQPHRMTLTDRYTLSLEAGTCYSPEANLEFTLSSGHDGFDYDGSDDATRLILSDLSMNNQRWEALYTPYDDAYQEWLINAYCPTAPTFPGCRADTKPPAALDVVELLMLNDASGDHHPPLAPGQPVTYTLHYQNPMAEAVTVPAYLYTNGDLELPYAGLFFPDVNWVDDCFGWLFLDLPPGAGTFALAGWVQDGGVHTLTLDIDPAYSRDGCAVSGNIDGAPGHRLQVEHTPDEGAPSYIAIDPDFTTSGPLNAVIVGVVQDDSAVPFLQIEVNGSEYFECEDETPTDGQWACAWDATATNGGSPPEDGTLVTLRVRAMDVFEQTSDWSAPREVRIDAKEPQMGAVSVATGDGLLDAVATSLINEPVLQLFGTVSDSVPLESVYVCDADGENCAEAALDAAPLSVPPAVYDYTDYPEAPIAIDDGTVCEGAGLVRTFDVGDSFTIAEMNMGLRLEHPYRSDLFATLTAPSGTSVPLFTFERNVLAENVNALFTDMGAEQLDRDLESHSLDGPYAKNTVRPLENLAAFAGEDALGTWTLLLCDRDPNSDVGAFDDAALHFTALLPPTVLTTNWSYSQDFGNSDGLPLIRQVIATDVNDHRNSTPVEISVIVDNVAPELSATQNMTQVVAGTTVTLLRGLASDGSAVEDVWVVVTDPLGRSTTEAITGTLDAWTYEMTPSIGGVYHLDVYASDQAGNRSAAGPFSLFALSPLHISHSIEPAENVKAGGTVTYTIRVENPNQDEMAQNMLLDAQLSQWLTPVETAGATVADFTLSWPAVDLEAGGVIEKVVLARLTDTLMITSTADGPLPVDEWVNLDGAIIESRVSVKTENLSEFEWHQNNFSVETLPIVKEEYVVPPDDATSDEDDEEIDDTGGEDGGDEPGDGESSGKEPGAAEQLLQPAMALAADGAVLNSVDWSPDDTQLASAAADGTIWVWDAALGETINTIQENSPQNIARWFFENGLLASGSESGFIDFMVPWSGELINSQSQSNSPVTSMVLSSNVGLYYGDAAGAVHSANPGGSVTLEALLGYEGAVTSLAIAPDDINLAVGRENGVLQLYANEEVFPTEGHEGAVTGLAWTSDGEALVSAATDGSVYLWGGAFQQPVETFEGGEGGGVTALALAPGDGLLIAGSEDGYVNIWSEDPEKPFSFKAHQGAITGIDWAADGSRFATSSSDGTVKVWSIVALAEVAGEVTTPSAAQQAWASVSETRLKQVDALDLNNAVGVDEGDQIYYYDGSSWTQIAGGLKYVSYGTDGSMWGVNASNIVYRRQEVSGNWERMDGQTLKQIDALEYNNAVGVGAGDNIFYYDGSSWVQISGSLKQASYGTDGSVWGVNVNNNVYRRQVLTGGWEAMQGQLLKQIDALDYNRAIGVDEDDQIYFYDGSSWTQIPGSLNHISFASDGSVWGIDQEGTIYHE